MKINTLKSHWRSRQDAAFSLKSNACGKPEQIGRAIGINGLHRLVFRCAFALVAACPAFAEPVSLSYDSREGDTATLHMESAVVGVLTYHNTSLMHSETGTWDVSSGAITCSLSIVVGGFETASVTCPPGWLVEPQEARVADGETFEFVIELNGF